MGITSSDHHKKVMEIKEFRLVRGPSYEEVLEFISRPFVSSLQDGCSFWGVHNHEASFGTSILIHLEKVEEIGLFHYLFWGSRKMIIWDSWCTFKYKHIDFCSGRWHTLFDWGTIKFGESSFLTNPLTKEEMDAIDARNI
ncbi:MAG TPA: hypothetical protein PKD95_04315 [Candidatus Paceibacterota bacterium]|nr:hypothetical protein [Candidatus Paceibacterota bacterium]